MSELEIKGIIKNCKINKPTKESLLMLERKMIQNFNIGK